jgi:hypothetical protein
MMTVLVIVGLQMSCQLKFFSDPQSGAASARIFLNFLLFGRHRPAGDFTDNGAVTAGADRLLWGADAVTALPSEKLLDQTILEGVEGYDSQSSTGSQ